MYFRSAGITYEVLFKSTNTSETCNADENKTKPVNLTNSAADCYSYLNCMQSFNVNDMVCENKTAKHYKKIRTTNS